MRVFLLSLLACGVATVPAAAQPPKKPAPKLDLSFWGKRPQVNAPDGVGPPIKGQVVDDKQEEPLDFPLAVEHGPALLSIATYVGKDGSRLANNLARELRQRQGLRAYVLRRQELGDPQYRELTAEERQAYFKQYLRMPRPLKYQIPPPVQFAVLVGDFSSLENDRNLDGVKAKLLALAPASFDEAVARELQWATPTSGKGRPQLLGLRGVVNPLRQKAERPALPPADLALLRKLNQSETSICRLDGRYTISLYRFQGASSIEAPDAQPKTGKGQAIDSLTIAAESTENLCKALRRQGIDARTFHGLTFSLVCFGAYNSRDDGQLADDLQKARLVKAGSLPMQPEILELPALFAGPLRGN